MSDTQQSNQEQSKKLCLECGEPIALAAKRCRLCGSFQDRRRYFTASQSSLTFMIAVIALIASLSDQFRAFGVSVMDFVSGTRFDYQTELVNFTADKLVMLVANRRPNTSAISHVMCLVHLPAIPSELQDRMWAANSEEWERETNVRRPEQFTYLTTVMLRYELDTPEILEPFEDELLSFDFVGSLWPSTRIENSDEIPSSVCVLGGAREGNPNSAGASLLTNSHLLQLDAVALLRATEGDETGIKEDQRAALLEKLLELRRQ
ncbi:MAG: hypothetical protein LC676_19775 [Loktanella sp.]|nr:hypothetical protein [Loktanella sp.]